MAWYWHSLERNGVPRGDFFVLPSIAVIGAGNCDAETIDLSRAVGSEIARRGSILVCGGLGGVMEGASVGALSQGGITVGILPGLDKKEANPSIRVPIATGMGNARNVIVVASADAVIAIAGGYGTLSEIALALKQGKPVIGLGTWELGAPIVKAQTAIEAVALAIELAAEE